MDFPGKNTGEGCHVLLQGIFLTQGSSLASPTLAGRFFITEPSGKLPQSLINSLISSLRAFTESLLCSWHGFPYFSLLYPNGHMPFPPVMLLSPCPYHDMFLHTSFVRPAIQVSAQSLPLNTVQGSDYAIGSQYLQSHPNKAHSLRRIHFDIWQN